MDSDFSFKKELKEIDTSPQACQRFAFWVGGVLVLIGVWLLFKDSPLGPWILGIGVCLIAVGAIHPKALRPLQWLWMALALVLGRLISPLVLGALYYFVFTPVGILARLFGKDFLQKKRQPDAPTYWQKKAPDPVPPRHDRQG